MLCSARFRGVSEYQEAGTRSRAGMRLRVARCWSLLAAALGGGSGRSQDLRRRHLPVPELPGGLLRAGRAVPSPSRRDLPAARACPRRCELSFAPQCAGRAPTRPSTASSSRAPASAAATRRSPASIRPTPPAGADAPTRRAVRAGPGQRRRGLRLRADRLRADARAGLRRRLPNTASSASRAGPASAAASRRRTSCGQSPLPGCQGDCPAGRGVSARVPRGDLRLLARRPATLAAPDLRRRLPEGPGLRARRRTGPPSATATRSSARTRRWGRPATARARLPDSSASLNTAPALRVRPADPLRAVAGAGLQRRLPDPATSAWPTRRAATASPDSCDQAPYPSCDADLSATGEMCVPAEHRRRRTATASRSPASWTRARPATGECKDPRRSASTSRASTSAAATRSTTARIRSVPTCDGICPTTSERACRTPGTTPAATASRSRASSRPTRHCERDCPDGHDLRGRPVGGPACRCVPEPCETSDAPTCDGPCDDPTQHCDLHRGPRPVPLPAARDLRAAPLSALRRRLSRRAGLRAGLDDGRRRSRLHLRADAVQDLPRPAVRRRVREPGPAVHPDQLTDKCTCDPPLRLRQQHCRSRRATSVPAGPGVQAERPRATANASRSSARGRPSRSARAVPAESEPDLRAQHQRHRRLQLPGRRPARTLPIGQICDGPCPFSDQTCESGPGRLLLRAAASLRSDHAVPGLRRHLPARVCLRAGRLGRSGALPLRAGPLRERPDRRLRRRLPAVRSSTASTCRSRRAGAAASASSSRRARAAGSRPATAHARSGSECVPDATPFKHCECKPVVNCNQSPFPACQGTARSTRTA